MWELRNLWNLDQEKSGLLDSLVIGPFTPRARPEQISDMIGIADRDTDTDCTDRT